MAAMTQTDWLRFFQQHRSVLLQCVMKISRCRETAQDIVQDTYLRVTRLTQSMEIAQPRAFLFKVATNLAIDYTRRQERRAAREVVALSLDDLPDAAPTPEATVETREEFATLQAAIAELPPKCRAVFLLHKAKHLTYGEIATRLGISRSAVEKHISKALAHCRDRLQRP